MKASYYAGGPLPNAETTWRVTSQPGHYSPPGWDDFTFGRWIPWWREWGDEGGWKETDGVHRTHRLGRCPPRAARLRQANPV